jgi:hypothetical protein
VLGDYQIRLNDHPYAFTEEITHLVVWSAVPFGTGVSHEERMVVYDEFVETHFAEIPREKRRWFLNWGSIQSVPGLEVRIHERRWGLMSSIFMFCYGMWIRHLWNGLLRRK